MKGSATLPLPTTAVRRSSHPGQVSSGTPSPLPSPPRQARLERRGTAATLPDVVYPTASTRSTTVRRFASPTRQDWEEPGAEPGVNTSSNTKPHYHDLHAECQITVVDFSKEKCQQTHLDNSTVGPFLREPREDWVACRWINVNGLSWDVIRTIGSICDLHQLAIEDVMNTSRSRTKVDWYSDQAFIVLTLQKLIDFISDEDVKYTETLGHLEDPYSRIKSSRLEGLRDFFSVCTGNLMPGGQRRAGRDAGQEPKSSLFAELGPSPQPSQPFRSLQQHRSLRNAARTRYMEEKSPLTESGLAVSVEQVSIFISKDNTVISLFEHSASDIENPMIVRLQNKDTILRNTCDPAMVVHGILDGIIDLAFPLIGAYEAIMGELELGVLMNAKLNHSHRLCMHLPHLACRPFIFNPLVLPFYWTTQLTSTDIMDSEIASLRNTIQPIIGVLNSLRANQRNQFSQPSGSTTPSRNLTSSVVFSAHAEVYLGDVDDHCVTILESIDNMRRTVDNLIDLIFNTMSAFQNESMKQLTVITIFFLPLTFLTGYFGMNFDTFSYVKDHSDKGFWYIAIPLMVVTIVALMNDMFVRVWKQLRDRNGIRKFRRASGLRKRVVPKQMRG